jgi:hypothetical protein
VELVLDLIIRIGEIDNDRLLRSGDRRMQRGSRSTIRCEPIENAGVRKLRKDGKSVRRDRPREDRFGIKGPFFQVGLRRNHLLLRLVLQRVGPVLVIFMVMLLVLWGKGVLPVQRAIFLIVLIYLLTRVKVWVIKQWVRWVIVLPDRVFRHHRLTLGLNLS